MKLGNTFSLPFTFYLAFFCNHFTIADLQDWEFALVKCDEYNFGPTKFQYPLVHSYILCSSLSKLSFNLTRYNGGPCQVFSGIGFLCGGSLESLKGKKI